MTKMSPPGTPGHGVAIIISAHPPGQGTGKMMPPGMKAEIADKKPDMTPDEDMGPAKDKDGKVSPEDAQVIRDDQHCINCENYDSTSGMCSKVSGPMAPDDACVKYFKAISDDDANEPDADDTSGGAPDSDADDQGVSATAA